MPAQRPPQLQQRFFWDNYVAVQHDRLGFLEKAAALGPVVALPMIGRNFYLINDAELIGQLLTEHSDVLIKALILRRAKRLLGDGLLTSENPLWRRQRKLVAHAFTPKRMAGYTETMQRATHDFIARWQSDDAVDIHEAMSRITLDIVAKTLFSADVIESAPRVAEALAVFTDFFSRELQRIVPPPAWWPSKASRDANRAMHVLDEIIASIIAQRRGDTTERADLLGALLRAHDDNAQGMSDKQLRDECLTLFLAGHETTALTLGHTLYLLSQHPEQEARLAHEVCGATFHDPLRVDDLARLRYTDAVLRESMRLYPPAWILARELTADITLGGYRLRKGETVLMSQWITHRNPAYFPEPERFLPERWLSPEIHNLPKFAYFPFGGGPRVCIGNHFAMTEAAIVLAALIQNFRFELLPGQQLILQPSITLRPAKGLRMRLHPRATPNADYASSKCLQNTSGMEAS